MATAPVVETDNKLSATGVRTSEELLRLEPEWKDLFRRVRCDNVFLSFEWMSEWWKHLGGGSDLFVVVVREAGRLVGLAPFYISSRGGLLKLRRVGFLGDRWVGSCYLDFLLDPAHAHNALECIATFMQHHRLRWDYMELPGTPDSVAATDFRNRMGGRNVSARVAPLSSSLYVNLPKTPELYFASHGKRMRRNLSYYSRALNREGTVEFVTIRDTSEINDAFDDLVHLHSARFAARGEVSAFLDPRVTSFHRSVLMALTKAGWVRIYLLRLEGRPIAGLYAFSAGKKMCFYQSGIDPAYSRFSVGVLLFSTAIEDAIRSHHCEVDFLSGEQTYKYHWATDTRETDIMWLIRRSGKGQIFEAKTAIATSLRKWKRRLGLQYGAAFRRVSASIGRDRSDS